MADIGGVIFMGDMLQFAAVGERCPSRFYTGFYTGHFVDPAVALLESGSELICSGSFPFKKSAIRS